MKTAFFLSRKLSLSSQGRKSTPAVKVATAAVALSVAVMLAAIAVVGGFKREIRGKVVGFNSHLTLYTVPMQGEDNVLTLSPTLENILDGEEYISAYDIEATVPGILKTDSDFKGIYFKGTRGTLLAPFLKENLEEGEVPDFAHPSDSLAVVITRKAADQLRLRAGDNIDTYFISDRLQTRRLKVAGIVNTHFDVYDDIYVYGPIALVQDLTGLKPNQGTALQAVTTDFDMLSIDADRLRVRMAQATASGEVFRNYGVETALTRGAHYFQWLSLLDTNVAVVLTLMTIVASITIISGMLIIILDKMRFIGLMKALGASSRLLRQVFVLLALKVAAIGMIIGNAAMLLFLWIQDRTHFIPLDPESYYIDFVPVELNSAMIVLLNIGVLAVILAVLLIPSAFVATIAPARTLRAE